MALKISLVGVAVVGTIVVAGLSAASAQTGGGMPPSSGSQFGPGSAPGAASSIGTPAAIGAAPSQPTSGVGTGTGTIPPALPAGTTR